MPDYRRYFVPGGTYFFTLVTYNRAPIFRDPVARAILREKIAIARNDWPFEMPAVVLLPDHLHVIWSLPPGDAEYPKRWGWIKKEFSKKWLAAGKAEQTVTPSQRRHRRRGVWQRKYWEHTIEDEDDFERHFDYIHYNPVKHGYVQRPRDWPWSTFHKWVEQGVYEPHWGSLELGRLMFDDLDETAME